MSVRSLSLSGCVCVLSLLSVVFVSFACSSTSTSTSSSAAGVPFGTQTYVAEDQSGTISRLTFTDSSHYTLTRWACTVRDTGCTESGTYTRDESAGTITFTRTDGGTFYSMTLPLGSFATGPATAAQVAPNVQGTVGDDDDDDDDDAGIGAGSGGSGSTGSTGGGGTLTPQDLSVGVDGGLIGSGGQLAFPVGTNIVQSFDLDGHSFTGATLTSADAGDLVTPAAGNWLPTVVNQQGTLVTSGGNVITPTVVTITWSADPNASKWEQFVDALAPSDYWKATATEYGVGTFTVGQHVRLTTSPPTNLTSDGMGKWIGTQIAAKGSKWPAPDGTTYYALFLPAITSSHLKEEGESGCDLFDGEHASDSYKGTSFAYAIMLQCPGDSAVDNVTSTAAHELVEGAADPWMKKPAYLGFDSAHLAWDLLQDFQDEVADACEDFPSINAQITSPTGTWAAQRTWSNAAALLGHDPCVPAPAGPYYTIYPQGMSTIAVRTPSDYSPPNPRADVGATMTGLGYKIAVGSSFAIPIQLVSDVAGTGPWTLAATEGAPKQFGGPTSKSLSLSLDKTSGSAGDIVHLTVAVKSANAKLHGELITIASTMNGVTHWAPILIGN